MNTSTNPDELVAPFMVAELSNLIKSYHPHLNKSLEKSYHYPAWKIQPQDGDDEAERTTHDDGRTRLHR